MRTAVEISKSLLERVRRIMNERRVTLRAVVEDRLGRVVRDGGVPGGSRLRDARFDGETGFAPGAGPDDIARVLRSEIRC